MDRKMLARLGAVVFVAVAITATVIELTRKDDTPIYQGLGGAVTTAPDPLRAILLHCQELGEAGTRDPSCLHAWAENRRRFLAPGTRPAERLPDPPAAPRNTSPASSSAAPARDEALGQQSAPAEDLPAGQRPEGR